MSEQMLSKRHFDALSSLVVEIQRLQRWIMDAHADAGMRGSDAAPAEHLQKWRYYLAAHRRVEAGIYGVISQNAAAAVKDETRDILNGWRDA